MARRFDVEGTRNYLLAAVILLVLSVWFIWDGWFPRASVLERHPEPSDHFYLFNKSVGVLFLVSAVVCGYIHLVVK